MNFLGSDKRVIGNIQLDDYQADAVSKIYNCSYNILSKGSKEHVLLHAPVGSGKTIMGAFTVNFFKRQMEELGYNEPISFIWISPDTGGINEQSKDSFLNILRDVRVIDIQQGKTEQRIPEDTILFVNWEKLTKAGNLMKEETENVVFKDILDNTRTKKVLIIDEAHIDWTTKGSEDSKVMQMIDADLIINLTATPDKRLRQRVKDENVVYISYKTVQEAGVIKKRVVVNSGVDEDTNYQEDENRTGTNQIPLLDVEQILLEKAIEKREHLEAISREINKDDYLVPLVLIQIPNASSLETITMDYVYDFLISKGIRKEKIGIWLSEVKENIEDLNNSDVEYLITKQAVAVGWDCPRAHVLVKLRESGSINFDIQTIGRVMRIPRGLNYTNPDLESAYIYTPHETFKFKGTATDYEKDIIKDLTRKDTEAKLKESFVDEIGVMGIPMYKRVRTKDVFVSSELLYNSLDREIKKGNYSFAYSAVAEIKREEEIDDFDVEENLKLTDDVVRKKLTTRELKMNYMRKISKAYNVVNLEPYVSNMLYEILLENDKDIAQLPYKETYKLIYTLFYNNEDSILFNISNAIRLYETDDNILQKETSNYTVQEKVYLGQVKRNTNDKYSYDKEPDLSDDSNPEEKFQTFLNNNKKVKYWFKNGIGKNDFSIVYKTDTLREYYPDFIAFDYDNNMYILDTKSNFGDDDFETTKAKYEAGLEYAKKDSVQKKLKELGFNNMVFSMIKYFTKGGSPYVLSKDEYTKDPNEWELFLI